MQDPATSQLLLESGVAALVIMRLLDMIAPLVKRAGKNNGEPKNLSEALVRLTVLTEGMTNHVELIDENGTVAFQKHDVRQEVTEKQAEERVTKVSTQTDNVRKLVHEGVLPRLQAIESDFKVHVERHREETEALRGGKR